MLRPEMTERVERYALGHCPFTGTDLWEHAEFELTKTTRGGQSPDLVGVWYVHVWLVNIQRAYGLFVAVWGDGHVGGVIEADGTQKVFEYHPSQAIPLERNWETYHEDDGV